MRAIVLLRDWAVRELGLTTLDILPHADNVPSRVVAERAGFAVDGRAGDDQADATGTAAGVPRAPLARRAAASDVPTASSVHVTGSSRNAAYSHVWTMTATKPGRDDRPVGVAAGAREQPDERRDEQRGVHARAR